jgi:hypothetical protein
MTDRPWTFTEPARRFLSNSTSFMAYTRIIQWRNLWQFRRYVQGVLLSGQRCSAPTDLLNEPLVFTARTIRYYLGSPREIAAYMYDGLF